jgi:hypothetical protein
MTRRGSRNGGRSRPAAAGRERYPLPSEYGAIYRATYGCQPLLAVLGDERRFVVQPFVKRPLNDLPFLKDRGRGTLL